VEINMSGKSLSLIFAKSAVSRLAVGFAATSIVIGAAGVQAADHGHRIAVERFQSQLQADANVNTTSARPDPLEHLTCKSLMASSPPLVPLCGEYR
jgi:hypothetical protein